MTLDIRRALGRWPALYRLTRSLYRSFFRPRRSPLGRRLHLLLGDREELFFIQVGANDGRHDDPLHRLVVEHPGWRGLFVEPVPYLFERLKSTYGSDDRFRFIRAAITDKTGTERFYYVDPEAANELGDRAPPSMEQLGSFHRQLIVDYRNGLLEPFIVDIEVPCLTWARLVGDCGVERIDLLHIDTEGHDYRILRQLDLRRDRPRVILYEHKHLSVADAATARRMLTEAGYRVEPIERDTLATLESRDGER